MVKLCCNQVVTSLTLAADCARIKLINQLSFLPNSYQYCCYCCFFSLLNFGLIESKNFRTVSNAAKSLDFLSLLVVECISQIKSMETPLYVNHLFESLLLPFLL